ncbi:hypothetical protein PICMEDRAFT_18820, partial [Pichia membranifaciens NRRL Y-2026]
MSASINRSLTTIKTELEFLLESEVISETLYDHIIASLPERYVKGMPMKDSTTKGEYAEAIYDYAPQQSDDLKLTRGDKITVLEKVSDAWWKGSVHGRSGMFPANYVKLYSEPSDDSRSAVNVAPPPSYQQSQPFYQQPQQQQMQQPYFQQQMQQPYYQQSQSSLNIPGQIPVGQPPMQQQPQQQGQHSGTFKRFGSKLGDAAIFGAGATIGSDLINSIF